MNEFEEKYSGYSNRQLIEIIDNKDDYQPLAVNAAETILNSRNLSDKELNGIRNDIEVEMKKEMEKKEKRFEALDKLLKIFSVYQPSKNKRVDQIIKLTAVVIIGHILYRFISDINLYIYSFKSLSNGDTTIFYLLIPIIIYIITLYLLVKGKKIGWIIFLIWISLTVLSSLTSIIQSFKYGTTQDSIDNILPTNNLEYFISVFVIYTVALIYYLSKPVRMHFNPKKENKE
ncbi:hypothetical protein ACFLTE_12390 [Bacteroidota bacterium]